MEYFRPVPDQCICHVTIVCCLWLHMVRHVELIRKRKSDRQENLPERNFMSTGAMGSGHNSTYNVERGIFQSLWAHSCKTAEFRHSSEFEILWSIFTKSRSISRSIVQIFKNVFLFPTLVRNQNKSETELFSKMRQVEIVRYAVKNYLADFFC